jgi:hypothetical protein
MAPVQTSLQDILANYKRSFSMKWYTFECNIITAILEGCAVKLSRHSSLAASEFSWNECVIRWNNLWTLLWNVSFICSSLNHLSFFPLSLSHLYHLPSLILLLILFMFSPYLLSSSSKLMSFKWSTMLCSSTAFFVKIHVICEHKQLYINNAFTYNTGWHKVLYEKLLVTQLVREVSYFFWHVYPEDHYNIHNNLPD